jgi:HTH-type transcriptional regulator, fmd operon transcriptional regulator
LLLKRKQRIAVAMAHGALTDAQYRVLALRGKGMTQQETAREMGTTRANVSMIELRARRKVARARETLDAYHSTLTNHIIKIQKGTRFYEIPSLVLREGDRWGIHMQSNVVEIIRLVKDMRPSCLAKGRTTRPIPFVFNKMGKLRIGIPTE